MTAVWSPLLTQYWVISLTHLRQFTDIFSVFMRLTANFRVKSALHFRLFLVSPSNACLFKLKADDTLDSAFNAGQSGANNIIYALASAGEGKIYAAGNFTQYNGFSCNRLVRFDTHARAMRRICTTMCGTRSTSPSGILSERANVSKLRRTGNLESLD